MQQIIKALRILTENAKLGQERKEEIQALLDDAEDGHVPWTRENLQDLDYRELQDLAQEYDIPANQSTEELIDALEGR